MKKENEKEKNTLLHIILTIIIIAILIKILMVTMGFYFVSGQSMLPTYHDSQIIKTTADFDNYDIKRGTIVVAKIPYNGKYIKRVVATPNDIVEIKNHSLYINNQKQQGYENIHSDDNIWKLSDDEFFLMGDNYNNSKDSRHFGPVTYKQILRIVHERDK